MNNLDVISNDVRYKGKDTPKGKKIKDVSDDLARRWFSMGFAKPVNKDGFETATKPAGKKAASTGGSAAGEGNSETRTDKDPEKKLTLDDLKQKEGGWYEFPDGSSAHGKKKAIAKLKEWNKG